MTKHANDQKQSNFNINEVKMSCDGKVRSTIFFTVFLSKGVKFWVKTLLINISLPQTYIPT